MNGPNGRNVERNAGKHPDNTLKHIYLAVDSSSTDPAFWSLLIDTCALAGVGVSALSMPFVVPAGDVTFPDDPHAKVVRGMDDLLALTGEMQAISVFSATQRTPDRCLTRLFTIAGALADRDGDLVADDTDIRFDLPDTLPVDVGAALANLAARIGLETGGVTLPLTGAAGTQFAVRIDGGEASLESTSTGWVARGDAQHLAELIDAVAEKWPHITAPETGGVTSSIGWLRRALAGDGPEPATTGDMLWELQWSAQWEIDRLWSAFVDRLLPQIDPRSPLKLTILASEPRDTRSDLAQRIKTALGQKGFEHATIESVCSFKSGLSWLREIVVPALVGHPVHRVRIEYRRFNVDADTLDPHTRWLQELFPGNEILAAALNIPLDAVEILEGSGPIFRAQAFSIDGETLGHWEFSPLHHTIPFVDALPESGTVCVTSGGFIAEQDGKRIELPVQTDLETFWEFWQGEILPRVLEEIDQRGGPQAALQPFFSRLQCELWISEPNSRIGIREENDSAAEALHEDIYFNTLDAIEMYGEQRSGERTNSPGAVVPVVHVQQSVTPHARVSLHRAPARQHLPYPEVRVRAVHLNGGEFVLDVTADDGSDATVQQLERLQHLDFSGTPSVAAQVTVGGRTVRLRLPLPQIIEPLQTPSVPPPMDVNIQGDDVRDWAAALAAYPEVTAWIEDYSYEGRPLVAMALSAPTGDGLRSPAKRSALKPTCLIVARHHANEISSTNAAFQLAWLCATDPGWRELLDRLNILILPYENPDGAALHSRLTNDPAARHWKHHPARYNALGAEFSQDFFNPNTRFGESRVRPAIWRRWLPDVIVDNHGVPSHEWVQPFAGFGSPPRFRVSYWIPQALLYGIIGFVDDGLYPEHRQAAMALRDAVSQAVAGTDIGRLNDTIGESYRFWGQDRDPERFPGEFHEGMLWHIRGAPASPEGRGFATRFPKTTVLSWVTEVNDETAEGAHLERTARAHLIANRAMLDLMANAAPTVSMEQTRHVDGRLSIAVSRKRPLDLGK